MIVCPRTVRRNLISAPATELISKHKKVVIYALNVPVEPAALDFFRVIKLCALSYLL